jgi:hypothetical protein
LPAIGFFIVLLACVAGTITSTTTCKCRILPFGFGRGAPALPPCIGSFGPINAKVRYLRERPKEFERLMAHVEAMREETKRMRKDAGSLFPPTDPSIEVGPVLMTD